MNCLSRSRSRVAPNLPNRRGGPGGGDPGAEPGSFARCRPGTTYISYIYTPDNVSLAGFKLGREIFGAGIPGGRAHIHFLYLQSQSFHSLVRVASVRRQDDLKARGSCRSPPSCGCFLRGQIRRGRYGERRGAGAAARATTVGVGRRAVGPGALRCHVRAEAPHPTSPAPMCKAFNAAAITRHGRRSGTHGQPHPAPLPCPKDAFLAHLRCCARMLLGGCRTANLPAQAATPCMPRPPSPPRPATSGSAPWSAAPSAPRRARAAPPRRAPSARRATRPTARAAACAPSAMAPRWPPALPTPSPSPASARRPGLPP
jgi:hypothetical protein